MSGGLRADPSGGKVYIQVDGSDIITVYSDSSLDAPITSETSGFTVADSHSGKIINLNGTFTVTFPSGLRAGWNALFVNIGSGTITFAAGSGATLNTKDDNVLLAADEGVTFYRENTSTYRGLGGLS